MAVKKDLELRKAKKKWFSVFSPEIFGSKELSEITAYEPDTLIGRHVEVWLKDLTNNPRDSSVISILKIVKVQGERADTKVIGIYVPESHIQRVSKRFCERIMQVFYAPTKDGAKLKFKLLYLVSKKIPASIRAKILKLVEQSVTEVIKEKDSSTVFHPDLQRKLGDQLKKDVKTIYPIEQVIVWKVMLEK